jgi:hypothetical protein
MTEFDPYFELGEMPTPNEDEGPFYSIYDEMDSETANNWPPYSMSPEAEEMMTGLTLGYLSQELCTVDKQASELARRRERILQIFHEEADWLNANPLE